MQIADSAPIPPARWCNVAPKLYYLIRPLFSIKEIQSAQLRSANSQPRTGLVVGHHSKMGNSRNAVNP
jgi:hypothetical protein